MHTVYIIDDDENLKNKLKEEFKKDDNYKFKQIRTEEIDVALKDIPALIIVNEDTISEKATEVCHKIRNNDDNSITPSGEIRKCPVSNNVWISVLIANPFATVSSPLYLKGLICAASKTSGIVTLVIIHLSHACNTAFLNAASNISFNG